MLRFNCGFFLILCCCLVLQGECYATLMIDQAEIAEGQFQANNASQANWHQVVLADVWRRQPVCRQGIWTYRIKLPQITSQQAQGLLIYRAGNRLRILLNDQELASYGSLNSDLADYSNHALMTELPRWPTADSELYLQVAGDCRRYSGLSQLRIDDLALIKDEWQKRYLIFMVSSAIIIVSCSLLALLSLSLAIWRRQLNPLLFGLASAFWALRAWLWSWQELNLPYAVWFFLIDLSFGIWMSLICLLALRVNKIEQVWLHRSQWLALIVFLISSLALVFGAPPQVKALGIDIVVLAGTVALLSIVWQAWRQPTAANLALASAGTTMLTLGCYDHWNVWMSHAADAYQRFYFTPLIVLFFILAIAVVLALQYEQAIRSDAQYRQVLESEVQQQRQVLQLAHQLAEKNARQEAISEERQRIVKDMHDGLGAQLVGMLSVVRHQQQSPAELESEIQQALDILRATIDTLSPAGEDVSMVLAQFRFRHEARFKRAGLNLIWQVDQLQTPDWNTQGLLHFEQILREVFTNILKHAGATKVVVSTQISAQRNELSICDNGQGFDVQAQTYGRGLTHLRERAATLAIDLQIDSAPQQGCCVKLGWTLLASQE